MENKRGIQLSQAFGAVLAVVLVALLVIIAIFLFQSLDDTFVDIPATTLNELDATIDNNTYTLVNASRCNAADFVIDGVANASLGNDTLISATRYSVTSATGVVINDTVVTLDNVTINYTYTWGGASCEASEEMIDQFATYPALVGLVGTIVFLGLVIGVLVASFIFGRRGRV